MSRAVNFVVSGILAATLAACVANAPAPPRAAAAFPPDPAALGVSGGPLGNTLDPEDRRVAGNAQLAAMETGQRKSWRGKKGVFGFVEPGTESARAGETCREYSHTIYIDGRPQTGKGLACRGGAGPWRIVS